MKDTVLAVVTLLLVTIIILAMIISFNHSSTKDHRNEIQSSSPATVVATNVETTETEPVRALRTDDGPSTGNPTTSRILETIVRRLTAAGLAGIL